MIVHINMNDFVYVKLKPAGIAALEKRHRELLITFPGIGEFQPPKEDLEGYSKWQMHQLMSTFGHLVGIGGLGLSEPFNLDVKVDVEDRVKNGVYYLDVSALQYFDIPKGSKIKKVDIYGENRECDFRIGLPYTKPVVFNGFDEYEVRLVWAAENITLGGNWLCAGNVEVYDTKLYVYYRKV